MTAEEARQVEQFFTMQRWIDLIDILFVLVCDPEKSIEREYADQLTSKRGTIMAEDTLQQLRDSALGARNKYGGRFKKTVLLDTTNTSPKEGVAIIADATLSAFSEFLDERIAVVPADAVSLPECGLTEDPAMIASFVGAVNNRREFVPRSLAETDSTRFQPIPCAMLRHDDKILVLKRKKKGHPLHDTYAVWAGGHVSQSDDSPDILRAALERELSEEVFIRDAFEISPEPVGLLRSNEDARASRHIGVLYELHLRSPQVALALNQKEFRETRGSSMSGKLIDVSRLGEIYAKMGDWSKFITDRYWPVTPPQEDGGRE